MRVKLQVRSITSLTLQRRLNPKLFCLTKSRRIFLLPLATAFLILFSRILLFDLIFFSKPMTMERRRYLLMKLIYFLLQKLFSLRERKKFYRYICYIAFFKHLKSECKDSKLHFKCLTINQSCHYDINCQKNTARKIKLNAAAHSALCLSPEARLCRLVCIAFNRHSAALDKPLFCFKHSTKKISE